ncbi:MAG: type II toxin-antitoxin system RelE/ParE family toxin [Bacteroidales bacterium]|nr:type II toxin-antitoxin system RelE/ParE family toxin [Bacteroidales bacterium]
MRVIWLPQAKEQLRNTAKYIYLTFGRNARENFILEVRQTTRLIGSNPLIGIEEPLLKGRSCSYRSLVVRHHNKIVYRILNNYVEVVAFWDTRREPKKQADNISE